MTTLRNRSSRYEPPHVRLAREEGNVQGARSIAKEIGFTPEELKAVGLATKPVSGISILTPEDTDVGC